MDILPWTDFSFSRTNWQWVETTDSRSAPVLGRSNVVLRTALEKPRAIASWTLLWPRTATLRVKAFLRMYSNARRQRSLTPLEDFFVK